MNSFLKWIKKNILPHCAIFSIIDKKTPSAIDVYRNNTELKIQHVIENNDTIQSDTTVVFKNHI